VDHHLHERQDLMVRAGGEPRRCQGLDRLESKLLEPSDLRLGEFLVGEIREWRASPEAQSFADRHLAPVRIAGSDGPGSLVHQPLEPARVDRIGIGLQGVAGGPGEDDRLAGHRIQYLPELGHVDLDRVGSRAGRSIVPHQLDQLVGGNDLVRVKEEDGQHGPLLRRPEVCELAVGGHFKRAEDAKSDARGRTGAPWWRRWLGPKRRERLR
jgi:hypothetical protein